MNRTLNQAEREYIKRNYETMTPEELCSDMNGIGVKAVETYIEDMKKAEAALAKDETLDEYHERLNDGVEVQDKESVKRLLARDPARGIVMMTEGASAMVDARKRIAIPHSQERIRKKSDTIFIPNPKRKCR